MDQEKLSKILPEANPEKFIRLEKDATVILLQTDIQGESLPIMTATLRGMDERTGDALVQVTVIPEIRALLDLVSRVADLGEPRLAPSFEPLVRRDAGDPHQGVSA